jgi:hypothetical protein
MDCNDILEPLASLVSSAFVDDMEHRFARNIENVDDYRVVEIDIVSQIELKTT